MTLSEFSDYYVIHDATILDLDFDSKNHTVKMLIEIPFWMQPDYVDGAPDLTQLLLIFKDVTKYETECPNPASENIEVLGTKASDSTLSFTLYDNDTIEACELRITASSVTASYVMTDTTPE